MKATGHTSKYLIAVAAMVLAHTTLAQDRPLTMDEVMRGAVQQKEMARQGAQQPSLPMDNSGMIDVNRIPDHSTSSKQPPSTGGGGCRWMEVDNSGALFGTGGIGAPISTQCMCNFQPAHESRCN